MAVVPQIPISLRSRMSLSTSLAQSWTESILDVVISQASSNNAEIVTRLRPPAAVVPASMCFGSLSIRWCWSKGLECFLYRPIVLSNGTIFHTPFPASMIILPVRLLKTYHIAKCSKPSLVGGNPVQQFAMAAVVRLGRARVVSGIFSPYLIGTTGSMMAPDSHEGKTRNVK